MRTVLLACLLLPLLALAAEEPFPQPPYSWRGLNGSGVFPAQDIVTEFHDLAADVVTSVKDAKKGELKLTLPGAPGSRKNIVWRTTLPHWGQNKEAGTCRPALQFMTRTRSKDSP